MVEEEDYCRYVGDHRQRQTHLEETRVDMTLNYMRRLGRERGEKNQIQQPGGQRYKKGQVTKLSGLYREE